MAFVRVHVAIVAMILCSLASAQAVPSPALSAEPTPMLGDRIRIRLPEGAVLKPRDVDRFSDNSSIEDETVATYELGEVTLRFEANMLFQTAGDDFEEILSKSLAQESEQPDVTSTELIRTENGFRVYLTTYKAEPEKFSCVVLHRAWVIHPDGFVEVVDGYAMEPSRPQLPACRAALLAALKTVEPGPAQMDMDTGARTLRFGPSGIELDVPDGYAATSYLGPDFWVHRSTKVVPFGEPAPSFGIYDGWFPGMFHSEDEKDAVETFKAPLFGRKVRWFRFQKEESFIAEAVFEVGKKKEGRKLHVFCAAPSAQERDELLPIVGTLRFVDDEPKAQ